MVVVVVVVGFCYSTRSCINCYDTHLLEYILIVLVKLIIDQGLCLICFLTVSSEEKKLVAAAALSNWRPWPLFIMGRVLSCKATYCLGGERVGCIHNDDGVVSESAATNNCVGGFCFCFCSWTSDDSTILHPKHAFSNVHYSSNIRDFFFDFFFLEMIN